MEYRELFDDQQWVVGWGVSPDSHNWQHSVGTLLCYTTGQRQDGAAIELTALPPW